jgi:hypothetical protein
MNLQVNEGELLEIVSALRNEAHRMRQHAAPGIVSVLALHPPRRRCAPIVRASRLREVRRRP